MTRYVVVGKTVIEDAEGVEEALDIARYGQVDWQCIDIEKPGRLQSIRSLPPKALVWASANTLLAVTGVISTFLWQN